MFHRDYETSSSVINNQEKHLHRGHKRNKNTQQYQPLVPAVDEPCLREITHSVDRNNERSIRTSNKLTKNGAKDNFSVSYPPLDDFTCCSNLDKMNVNKTARTSKHAGPVILSEDLENYQTVCSISW